MLSAIIVLFNSKDTFPELQAIGDPLELLIIKNTNDFSEDFL